MDARQKNSKNMVFIYITLVLTLITLKSSFAASNDVPVIGLVANYSACAMSCRSHGIGVVAVCKRMKTGCQCRCSR